MSARHEIIEARAALNIGPAAAAYRRIMKLSSISQIGHLLYNESTNLSPIIYLPLVGNQAQALSAASRARVGIVPRAGRKSQSCKISHLAL